MNQECGRRGVEGIVGVEGELGSMWRGRWGGWERVLRGDELGLYIQRL